MARMLSQSRNDRRQFLERVGSAARGHRGSALGAADISYETALSPYFPPADAGRSFRGQRIPGALVDEAERQLDHLATLLDRLGIVVRRPDPVRPRDRREDAGTGRLPVGRANACPRDTLLVIGG